MVIKMFSRKYQPDLADKIKDEILKYANYPAVIGNREDLRVNDLLTYLSYATGKLITMENVENMMLLSIEAWNPYTGHLYNKVWALARRIEEERNSLERLTKIFGGSPLEMNEGELSKILNKMEEMSDKIYQGLNQNNGLYSSATFKIDTSIITSLHTKVQEHKD